MTKLKKIAAAVAVFVPALALAQGALENPANNVTDSGIGVISGWHCSASRVEAVIDGVSAGFAYVGSERLDTVNICGKTGSGFALLINFNNLIPGNHNLKIYANGVQFGESNFKTTRSGGTQYLTNKSKTVNVPDFPSPGASATLTWSETRQSFVVTNISNYPGPPGPVLNGLEKLYGRVTFNYKFNSSNTRYDDSFYFSSANYSDNSKSLSSTVEGKDKSVACNIINQNGYEFLCLIREPLGGRDAFVLNVNTAGSVYGRYEYCPVASSDSQCVRELLISPDGVVDGHVVAPRAAGFKGAEAALARTPETKESLKALQLQHEAQEPSTESATPEQIDAVLDAFERLAH